MAIIKRTTKGSALTHAELDGNFDHLDSVKVEKSTLGNNQLLYRDKDGNLTVLTVNEQELVGRLTGNNIDGLDATTVKNILSLVIADVSGLQTTLDGKASTSHIHSIADVTDLATELAGKTDIGHTHSISDITNLQSTLDAMPKWEVLSLTSTDIGALSGTSGTIDIKTLSTNSTILGVKLVVVNGFSGGSNTTIDGELVIDTPSDTIISSSSLLTSNTFTGSGIYHNGIDTPSSKIQLNLSADVELSSIDSGDAKIFILSTEDTNALTI